MKERKKDIRKEPIWKGVSFRKVIISFMMAISFDLNP